MSWYDWLFGKGDDEKNEQMQETPYSPYADKQIEELKKYLSPFIERGEQVAGGYTDTSRSMMEDPNAYYNKLMGGYKESPTYQKKMDDMMRRARSAAAAGGMVGTPQDQEAQMTLSNALLDEDMQKWLGNIMGIQKTGMAGVQDIYGRGASSAGGLGEDIASIYGGKGAAAIQKQRDEENRTNSLASALFKGLGTLGGAGIGYALGNAPGAAIGANIGSRIGG